MPPRTPGNGSIPRQVSPWGVPVDTRDLCTRGLEGLLVRKVLWCSPGVRGSRGSSLQELQIEPRRHFSNRSLILSVPRCEERFSLRVVRKRVPQFQSCNSESSSLSYSDSFLQTGIQSSATSSLICSKHRSPTHWNSSCKLIRGFNMVGFITTRHLITHAPMILREFGPRTYWRCVRTCLFSSKPTTFLQCVWH